MQQYSQYPQNNQGWRNYQQWPDPENLIQALMPSYTAKAFLIFILYFFGYFPGLICNIVCLVSALGTQQRFKRTPQGNFYSYAVFRH